jgi:predicted transcriptional regulator
MEKKPIKRGRGRPKGKPKKAVFAKIDPETLREFDQIRETMAPPPSQSALINQAVKEYVDRHRKADQGKKEPID